MNDNDNRAQRLAPLLGVLLRRNSHEGIISAHELRIGAGSERPAEQAEALLMSHIVLERVLSTLGYMKETFDDGGRVTRTPIADALKPAIASGRLSSETARALGHLSSIRNHYVHRAIRPSAETCRDAVELVLDAALALVDRCSASACMARCEAVCSCCDFSGFCAPHGDDGSSAERCSNGACANITCVRCLRQSGSERYESGPWVCAECDAVTCACCARESQRFPGETLFGPNSHQNRWLCRKCVGEAKLLPSVTTRRVVTAPYAADSADDIFADLEVDTLPVIWSHR